MITVITTVIEMCWTELLLLQKSKLKPNSLFSSAIKSTVFSIVLQLVIFPLHNHTSKHLSCGKHCELALAAFVHAKDPVLVFVDNIYILLTPYSVAPHCNIARGLNGEWKCLL